MHEGTTMTLDDTRFNSDQECDQTTAKLLKSMVEKCPAIQKMVQQFRRRCKQCSDLCDSIATIDSAIERLSAAYESLKRKDKNSARNPYFNTDAQKHNNELQKARSNIAQLLGKLLDTSNGHNPDRMRILREQRAGGCGTAEAKKWF